MRCEPDEVYSVIRPPVPVPRMIPLAIVWLARMVLTDDASGRAGAGGMRRDESAAGALRDGDGAGEAEHASGRHATDAGHLHVDRTVGGDRTACAERGCRPAGSA